MRFMLKAALLVGISFVLFGLIQVLFGGTHCFDCGAKYGFPFSYMQDGTYATHGHVIWSGLIGDFAITLAISTGAAWVWRKRKVSK
jgi:hypothetical protein